MKFDYIHKSSKALPPPRLTIALDPGGTTGWCAFEELKLIGCGQLVGGTAEEHAKMILVKVLQPYYKQYVGSGEIAFVMEDYRVYATHREQHVNSNLPTPQKIGAIRFAADMCGYPEPVMQMASQGKGFCTDEKLKAWGFYIVGQRHARDAIRHAAYYILFRKKRVGIKE